MDELFKAAGAVLQQLGLAGLVIGALAFGIFYLFKELVNSYNARITEGKEAVKAIEATTDALGTLTEALKTKAG